MSTQKLPRTCDHTKSILKKVCVNQSRLLLLLLEIEASERLHGGLGDKQTLGIIRQEHKHCYTLTSSPGGAKILLNKAILIPHWRNSSLSLLVTFPRQSWVP